VLFRNGEAAARGNTSGDGAKLAWSDSGVDAICDIRTDLHLLDPLLGLVPAYLPGLLDLEYAGLF
jgi:hypothetical protein